MDHHQHGPNCGCGDYAGINLHGDLLGSIQIDNLIALNEQTANSCKTIFKPYENRFDESPCLESACDGEVVLIVPFKTQVKIKSICVVGKDFESSPTKMRLFINRENVDFSITEQPAIQQFEIGQNPNAQYHCAVKPQKFTSVYKLILHLRSQTIERIGIKYIQIKGEDTKIKRTPVVTTYEIRPVPEKQNIQQAFKTQFQM